MRIKSVKSQSWSIEFIIAISLFIAAFILIYSLMGFGSNPKGDQLQKDAFFISKQTSEEKLSLSIVEKDTINDTKLESLIEKEYPALKTELGIQNDFCIFFEDEKGNVVTIREGVVGVGSPEIKVGGIKCT